MKNINWKIAAASATGKGHQECQDSFAYEILDNLTICVVADGAGSQKNSKLGSSLVSELALKYFKQYTLKHKLNRNAIPLSSDVWRKDSIAILKQVKSDLDKVATKKKCDVNTMASTVIVVISTPDTIYTSHIGDGRAGYMNTKDEWKSLITPYIGSEVGMTVFLTTEYIWQYAQEYIETNVIHDEIKAVTLLSDGAEGPSFKCTNFDEESQKYVDINKPGSIFYNPCVKFILDNKDELEDDVNVVWKKFLEDGSPSFRTEKDDKTMLLAVNYEV